MIRIAYAVFDHTIVLLIEKVFSLETYAKRLNREAVVFVHNKVFDGGKLGYYVTLFSTAHDRASAMIGHLSIMLALSFASIELTEVQDITYQNLLYAELGFCVLLLLLVLRALRPFGLSHSIWGNRLNQVLDNIGNSEEIDVEENDENEIERCSDEYLDSIKNEVALKFLLLDIVTCGAMFAITFLVLVVSIYETGFLSWVPETLPNNLE